MNLTFSDEYTPPSEKVKQKHDNEDVIVREIPSIYLEDRVAASTADAFA